MLDIKFIRENKEVVQEGAKKKNVDIDIQALVDLDDKRKELLTSIENKRAEQNAMSEKISKANSHEKEKMIEDMKVVKESLQKEEETLKDIMKSWQELMLRVPNIPDMSVPEGNSEEDNKEIKSWGEKPAFDFEPKDHVEIMSKLGMLDIERGTKVNGFRGYFLIGDGVRLTFAIWQYCLDFFEKKKFIPVISPSIVRKINLYGTGHLPGDVEDFYTTQDGDVLSGTAEEPLMAMHGEEVLPLADLPKRYLGFSPCFRREAGAHSKDIKGLIRVHEFYKFEQLILCEAS